MEQEVKLSAPGQVKPELLKNIYDTVPCGILRFRREGDRFELLSLNKAAQTLLGYSDSEEGLADWHNGIAGSVLVEDWPALKSANASLHKVGDRAEVTYRARTPEGGVRWLSGYNTLVEAHPDYDVIQRTMFDVTDRQLLQEQLRKEREMYRIAMESSSDVMFEYRVDEDMLTTYEPRPDGVLRTETPGFRLAVTGGGMVHPDDAQLVIDNLCDLRAETFECRLVQADRPGVYLWNRVTGKRVATSGKERVVGTLHNIQREKETTLAERASLHMHESALQALSSVYMSIYYVDLPENRYYGVRIPDARQAVIPRSGMYQSVMSIYFSSHVAVEDLPSVLPFADPQYIMSKLRAVGQRMEVEFCYNKNSDQPMWLRLECQLVSTEDGVPKNAICAFRNVSEQRREAEARRKEDETARRALEDAFKTARDASEAKSDFLSKMSHDMRTPMNAIIGMTTVALNKLDDGEKVEDCLKKIQSSGRHLLNLINDVLDMSRIESNRLTIHQSAFDLSALVTEIADMLHDEFESRGHEFELKIDITHSAVLGDALRIQEILLNLLSNSAKYTHDGGHIRLEVTEAPYFSETASRFIIVVEDDGIGMTKDFLTRVFNPFERAEDSRVSSIRGTGLGMTITHNLVRLMNGTINVESEPDEGTRVTVTLSLQRAQHPIQKTEPHSDTPARFRSDAHILLVEDNELNREIALELLAMAGLTADEAVNGSEALATFEESPEGYYDLILMDIQMPVLDGYEATRAIRKLERADAETVPIIALTANAFAEDVSRARQAGMNEHLSKPLEVEALNAALARWIK